MRRGIASKKTAALAVIAFMLAGASFAINRTPVTIHPPITGDCSGSPNQFIITINLSGVVCFNLFGTANTWTLAQTFSAGANLGNPTNPINDAGTNLGTANLRWNFVDVASGFRLFTTVGAANPAILIDNLPAIRFGAGQNSVVDFNLTRISSTEWAFMFGHTKLFGLSNTGVRCTQGYQSIISQSLTNGVATSTTVSLCVNEPDTSYGVVCTGSSITGGTLYVTGKATNQFVVNYAALGAGTETVDCIITHK